MEQMEQHVKRQYSDPLRNVPLGRPGYVPEFNIMPPKLSEVRHVMKKARSHQHQAPVESPTSSIIRY